MTNSWSIDCALPIRERSSLGNDPDSLPTEDFISARCSTLRVTEGCRQVPGCCPPPSRMVESRLGSVAEIHDLFFFSRKW